MAHYWFQGGEPPGRIREDDIDLPSDKFAVNLAALLAARWEQDVRVWQSNARPIGKDPLDTAVWDGHERDAEPTKEDP